MFGLGGGEIVVIIVVALLVFGPQKLPEVARTVSRAYKEWTKVRGHVDDTISEIRRDINIKAQLEDELTPLIRPDERSQPVRPAPQGEVNPPPPLPIPEGDDYLAAAPEPVDVQGDDYLAGDDK